MARRVRHFHRHRQCVAPHRWRRSHLRQHLPRLSRRRRHTQIPRLHRLVWPADVTPPMSVPLAVPPAARFGSGCAFCHRICPVRETARGKRRGEGGGATTGCTHAHTHTRTRTRQRRQGVHLHMGSVSSQATVRPSSSCIAAIISMVHTSTSGQPAASFLRLWTCSGRRSSSSWALWRGDKAHRTWSLVQTRFPRRCRGGSPPAPPPLHCHRSQPRCRLPP
jgi:hypothetical protein